MNQVFYQPALEKIKQSQKILLLTHLNPDGDALGSMLGMGLALKNSFPDKKVVMACAADIPPLYYFLPSWEKIQSDLGQRDLIISMDCEETVVDKVSYNLKGNRLELRLVPVEGSFKGENIDYYYGSPAFDLIMTFDCGELARLGNIYEKNKQFFQKVSIINIDHHASNDNFGEVNVIDAKAAATGELVFDLLKNLNVKWNADIATCILTALVTDTHNFQHSSTTNTSFQKASFLLSQGARHQQIVEEVFRKKKYGVIKLWGRVLSKVKNLPDYKVLWSTVTQADAKAFNVKVEAAEGVIDELMMGTPEADLIMILYEYPEGLIRGSIRTTSQIDASKIAEKLGGGGHDRAAGFRVQNTTLQEVEQQVLRLIKERLGGGSGNSLSDLAIPVPEAPADFYKPEDIINKIGGAINGKDKTGTKNK